MRLRPYQERTIDAVIDGWNEWRRQLVVLPTGSGKTIIFSHLAARHPGRTLILAHREELIDQAIDKLHRATGIFADKEKAEARAAFDSKVVVASVQTLMREERLARWPRDHFGLVVCDEAHHALSASWQRVLNHFDGDSRILGVTATADRADARNLGEFFENIPAEVSLFELIAEGYLARIVIQCVPLRIDLSAVRSVAGDLDERGVADALEPYLEPIAQAIKQHASFRRVLCFLPLIATSQKFVEACRGVGLRARHIDGESPDRAEILDQFRAWDFDVLGNAMLLTEGYDDAGIDALVVLRPTRSRPLYAQMIGRGTRIAPGKENLLVLDFLWHHERHSITRPAHLIARSDAEADLMTSLSQTRAGLPAEIAAEMPLDLEDLAGSATAEREKKLREGIEANRNKQAVRLSADECALEWHQPQLIDYEPVMKWEADPVTDKQAKFLARAGIDPGTVRGKGHASRLLSIYVSQVAPRRMASPGQRWKMRQLGAPNWEHATEHEARQFFAGLRKVTA